MSAMSGSPVIQLSGDGWPKLPFVQVACFRLYGRAVLKVRFQATVM